MTAGTDGAAAPRYRKRPVEVRAIQWTGDNLDEIYEFTGRDKFDLLDEQQRRDCDDPEATAAVFDILHSTWVLVLPGQWIIKGIRGEFYPCAADVFAETYEPAGDHDDDGRHPDGCTCRFCREDEREERERADREDAADDGPYYVELDGTPPHPPLTADAYEKHLDQVLTPVRAEVDRLRAEQQRQAEQHARDMAAEDGDYDRCEPTL